MDGVGAYSGWISSGVEWACLFDGFGLVAMDGTGQLHRLVADTHNGNTGLGF